MSFIFFLIIIGIFILILIPTFIFSAIRTILSVLGFMFIGRKRRHSSSYNEERDFRYKHTSNGGRDSSNSSAARKKMFEKNEGEYVDFEEIKEDK